jgi:hypothetical protein
MLLLHILGTQSSRKTSNILVQDWNQLLILINTFRSFFSHIMTPRHKDGGKITY